MSGGNMKRRSKNPNGSETELTREDGMEMYGRSRPESAASGRRAWLDDGPGQDDVDYSPRNMTAADAHSMGGQTPMGGTKVASDQRAYQTNAPPPGISKKIQRGLRSLWKTRLTEDTDDDPELYVKTTLRELGIYVAFVVVLCIMTFGMTNSTMYYFTKVMKDLFVNKPGYDGLTTLKDFFSYTEGALMDGLYWENYYNGKVVPKDQQGYIYYENKLLGRPRLRQLRVRSNSCVVHDDFKREIKSCYGPYTADNEEKKTYGLENGTAWNYKTAKDLNGGSFWGRMATYQGGGYTQLLGNNSAESKDILAKLKKNLWVDRGTRAVMIDFTVYNANINLFCIVTLVLEYPATGGCIPFHMFRTLKLIRYVNTMDYFIMGCEGLFVLFLMYYTIEEMIEIKKHKSSYFKDFWNIMDLIVVFMGYICVLFSVYRTMEVGKLLGGLLKDQQQYANFEVLGYWQMQFNNLVAIAVFFAWIKVFKYISFNKTMTQLQNTLASCAKDIAGFAVMFFIIFLAYAQWGYLIFGTQVADFSTYVDSIFTLFRIILGDFNFKEIEDANRILGPIFFITYVFFVFFVLINMFLAIINDTYAEVKADLESRESEFEIGDYFKKGYDKMMNKLSFKREKIVDIQKALQTADSNQDSKLDFEEWRQELKNRGHADAEIEAVFAKYDVDGDRCLNEEEQIKMQEDLEGQKEELNEEIEEVNRAKDVGKSSLSLRGDSDDEDEDDEGRRGRRGGISSEEFAVLSRRVDRVEHSIGSIVSKIDAVLVKLEAMDKAKVKRRETMTKLLDSITEDCQGDEAKRREKMEGIVRGELDRWDSQASVRDSRLSLRDGKK